MFRVLIAPVFVALALSGCSKNNEGDLGNADASKAKASDTKTSGAATDAASYAGNTAKDVGQDAANAVKESGAESKDAAAKAVPKAKKGTAEATRKASDKAKVVHLAAATDWSDFQTMMKKCDALLGAARNQCLMDAKATYRASNFDCETVAPQDQAQCRQYLEQWNSANSANASQTNSPVVRSGEPNTIPADPGDPSDKERNRDSTKQQAAAPQPHKQN